MLPIRQTLNALPSLKRTEKAVLIEVCQLAENSEPAGWCTAKNDYLVQALGGTERTMTRTIAALEARGLLLSKGAGKARKLAPTPALRACYAGAEEADRRTALAVLNLDKKGAEPRQIAPANLDNSGTNLDKNSPEPSQNGEVEPAQPRQNGSTNLDKSGHQPRQNGSRVYGDQQYQQVTSTPPTPEEWVGAQKKIADLERENASLKAKILELVPPVAAPPQKPAVEMQGPQHSLASKALSAEMAKLWNISQMPSGGRKWGQVARFAHEMEQAGRLEEAAKQFAGFRLWVEKRRIEPMNLDKYLGSEGEGYPGEWCQTIWTEKAQAATAASDTSRGVAPTPTRTNLNLKTAATQQQQPII
jgi:hypothetical protein